MKQEIFEVNDFHNAFDNNFDNYDDDFDILNDVRNLFMNDEDYNEEGGDISNSNSNTKVLIAEKEGPKVIFDGKKGSESETVKNPDTKTNKKTVTETVIFDGKTQPKTTAKGNVIKCKNNSDCDVNSFCHSKSGKCLAKLSLGQSDCTANDQCADPTAVCYSKKCLQSCTLDNGDGCKVKGEECVAVKDLKVFTGIKGGNLFNGVCEKAVEINSSSNPNENTTTTSTTTKSSSNMSSIAIISGSAALLLTIAIFGFIYLRGYLKRRNRNNNPDMFLFNKLQRNASQGVLPQTQNPGDRLNARLSSVGGARFTRWAVLSAPEN